MTPAYTRGDELREVSLRRLLFREVFTLPEPHAPPPPPIPTPAMLLLPEVVVVVVVVVRMLQVQTTSRLFTSGVFVAATPPPSCARRFIAIRAAQIPVTSSPSDALRFRLTVARTTSGLLLLLLLLPVKTVATPLVVGFVGFVEYLSEFVVRSELFLLQLLVTPPITSNRKLVATSSGLKRRKLYCRDNVANIRMSTLRNHATV